MNEQHAFRYDAAGQLVTRRRAPTPEELAASYAARSGFAPSTSRSTHTHDVPPTSTHRTGHYAGTHPEDAPYSSQEFPVSPTNKRPRSQPADEDDDGGDYQEPHRSPTSARRYTNTQGGSFNPKQTRRLPRSRFSSRGLVYVVVGLLVMLVGWQLFTVVGAWWQTQQNDWTYGRPRTYQVDAVVGHSDSVKNPSHFIALNLNRQVIVMELPGGNPAKAHVYLGPTLMGDGQDLIPITLSFEDRNGDGKPDLNIHLGDQVIVFLNNGTTFVSPPPPP